MNNPLVSIIIPSHNYRKYIDHCLRSCLSQSYKNVEVVVIDDYSTDGSQEIIEFHVHNFEGVQAYLALENNGYSWAKNAGIAMSHGDLIVHLDADDLLTPDSIERRVVEFQVDPDLEFLHAQALKFFGDKDYMWCLKNHDKLEVDNKAFIHAQSFMVRRDVYEKYGLYCEYMRSKSDKEILTRWRICKGQDKPLVKAKKIEYPVAYYRRHNKCMLEMRRKNKKYDAKITKMFKDRAAAYEKDGITMENTPWRLQNESPAT